MGRLLRKPLGGIHTADCQIDADLYGWAERLRRDNAPSTVRLKVRCARTCFELLGRYDPEGVVTEDLDTVYGMLPPSTEMNKQRYLRYFGDFIGFLTGRDVYREYESVCRGECDTSGIGCPYDDELDDWAEWMVSHGMGPMNAGTHRGLARRGLLHLLRTHPGIVPSDIGADHILEVSEQVGRDPGCGNKVANSLARFAEWSGAGAVQAQFHDLRTFGIWSSRVFSGKFGDRIRSYYDHMIEFRYRPSTCQSQVNSVVYAIRVIESVIGDFELEDITVEDLRDVRYEQDRVSELTLRTYLTVFGQFCLHAIGRNPYSDRLMRWNEGIVQSRIFLSDDQWAEIVQNADPTERIVVVLGSLMGLRKSEMVNLMVSDVGDRTLHVCGKGHGHSGKESELMLDEDTRYFIDQYLEYRAGVLEGCGDFSYGRLIVCDSGTNAGKPFTPEGIASMIRRFSDRLGFRFSCHCFRRYYATSLYEDGVDQNMIRIMMRHVKLDTTLNRYINVNTQRILKAQERIGGRMRKVLTA